MNLKHNFILHKFTFYALPIFNLNNAQNIKDIGTLNQKQLNIKTNI